VPSPPGMPAAAAEQCQVSSARSAMQHLNLLLGKFPCLAGIGTVVNGSALLPHIPRY
jgi:hypothetical protein